MTTSTQLFKQGQQHYQNKDYDAAYNDYKQASDQTFIKAHIALAEMLLNPNIIFSAKSDDEKENNRQAIKLCENIKTKKEDSIKKIKEILQPVVNNKNNSAEIQGEACFCLSKITSNTAEVKAESIEWLMKGLLLNDQSQYFQHLCETLNKTNENNIKKLPKSKMNNIYKNITSMIEEESNLGAKAKTCIVFLTFVHQHIDEFHVDEEKIQQKSPMRQLSITKLWMGQTCNGTQKEVRQEAEALTKEKVAESIIAILDDILEDNTQESKQCYFFVFETLLLENFVIEKNKKDRYFEHIKQYLRSLKNKSIQLSPYDIKLSEKFCRHIEKQDVQNIKTAIEILDGIFNHPITYDSQYKTVQKLLSDFYKATNRLTELKKFNQKLTDFGDPETLYKKAISILLTTTTENSIPKLSQETQESSLLIDDDEMMSDILNSSQEDLKSVNILKIKNSHKLVSIKDVENLKKIIGLLEVAALKEHQSALELLKKLAKLEQSEYETITPEAVLTIERILKEKKDTAHKKSKSNIFYLDKKIYQGLAKKVRDAYEEALKHERPGIYFEMANLRYQGNIFEKNIFFARNLFSMAIKKIKNNRNDIPMIEACSYAKMCFNGDGGNIDLVQSKEILKLFDLEKLPEEFTYLLGDIYYNDYLLANHNKKQVQDSIKKTAHCYAIAAKQGHIDAYLSLLILAEKEPENHDVQQALQLIKENTSIYNDLEQHKPNSNKNTSALSKDSTESPSEDSDSEHERFFLQSDHHKTPATGKDKIDGFIKVLKTDKLKKQLEKLLNEELKKENYKEEKNKIKYIFSNLLLKNERKRTDKEDVEKDLRILNHYASQNNIVEGLQQIKTNFCIASFRGLHFNKESWSQTTRRTYRQFVLDKKHPFLNQPIYSEAVHYHAGIPSHSYNSAIGEYNRIEQLKLEKSARFIHIQLCELYNENRHDHNNLPITLTGKKVFLRNHDNRRYQVQELYSNHYDNFHQQYLPWETQQTPHFFANQKNHFVSTGDARHASAYASGTKVYSKHANNLLRPSYNHELCNERLYTGAVLLTLHPVGDLTETKHSYIPQLNRAAKIIVAERTVPEQETTFFGYIPSGRLKFIQLIKYPSFHHENYLHLMYYSYGINKEIYDKFKSILKKYEKDSTNYNLTILLLGEYINAFHTLYLQWEAYSRASKEGYVLVYRDELGTFSLKPVSYNSCVPNGDNDGDRLVRTNVMLSRKNNLFSSSPVVPSDSLSDSLSDNLEDDSSIDDDNDGHYSGLGKRKKCNG